MFASMNSSKFSKDPVVMKGKGGIAAYDRDFLESVQNEPVERVPRRKSVVDVMREEGVEPDNLREIMAKAKKESDFSRRELDEYKDVYEAFWMDKDFTPENANAARQFLSAMMESEDAATSRWAQSELADLGAAEESRFSKNALNKAKMEYEEIWFNDNLTYNQQETKALKFLDEKSKSKDEDVSEWAGKEIEKIYMDKKTERDERNMEDMSFYTGDPDAGRSEEDIRGELEMEDERFSKESLAVAEDALKRMQDKGARAEEINAYLEGMSKMDDKDVSRWAKQKIREKEVVVSEPTTVSNEPTVYDKEQVIKGLEVEKKHKPTYDDVEAYYTKNERMMPEISFYQSLVEDNLDVDSTYYSA